MSLISSHDIQRLPDIDDDDDIIVVVTTLVSDLSSSSSSPDTLLAVTARLRQISKLHPALRPLIANSPDVVPSLVSHFSDNNDPLLQEHAVATILNLSLSPPNIPLLANTTPSLIPSLVHVINSSGATQSVKASAACTLFRLATTRETKSEIVKSGAVSALIRLMESGSARGKKDALTAMYGICEKSRESKVRAVEEGAVRVLVELVEGGEVGVADKAGYLMWGLVGEEEGRAKLVEEGGIGVVVDVVGLGSRREKEIAVWVLLEMCEASGEYCQLVAKEGAVPSLIALSESRRLNSATTKKVLL